jgi:hypothetical protein
MTLTIHDLMEFKRRELDSHSAITQPPPNFLQELKPYMINVQEEAGPHPVEWDANCEALAAIEILEDVFRVRREKLIALARDNENPDAAALLDFETIAWKEMRHVFEELERSARRAIIPTRPLKTRIIPELTVTLGGKRL